MTLPQGQTITLPAGEDPSWFRHALQRERDERVGTVPITVAGLGGQQVSGDLHATDEGVEHDSFGNVYLEPLGDRDELHTIACERITGFYLHPDRPVDRSDELGRER